MAGTRRLGVAMDFSPGSINALQWMVDNIVKEGDNIILIIIHPEEYEHGEMQLWAVTGSPLTPLAEFSDSTLSKKYGFNPNQEVIKISTAVMEQKKVRFNHDNILNIYYKRSSKLLSPALEVDVLVKIYWGDAREKLCEAIEHTPLDALTMGSRGLGTLKRAIMGSVSNYVVNNATCPVTVVKSSAQHN